MFDDESLTDLVDSIEIYDEEFNPTWIVTFDYDEDHNVLNNRLNNVCTRIKEALEKVFIDIEGKCEEYQ